MIYLVGRAIQLSINWSQELTKSRIHVKQMFPRHYVKCYKRPKWTLKDWYANKSSTTTIAIHFNLLHFYPSLPPFVLALLYIPSFHILSSCFMFHSVLVADPTVIIILIKFRDTAVQSMIALTTLTKDEDEPGLNCSAVILVIQIPIPSINASKMAPTAADLTAAEGPPKNNQSTR